MNVEILNPIQDPLPYGGIKRRKSPIENLHIDWGY